MYKKKNERKIKLVMQVEVKYLHTQCTCIKLNKKSP